MIGSVISLLASPGKKLIIKKYMKRIYYCEEVGDFDHKLLAYFERELIPVPAQ